MHGDEDTCFHFDERAHGFFRVHVYVASAGGVVGADGHECDVWGVVFANFLEAVEVGAIAAVEDLALTGVDHVATVIAVGVVEVACTPVVAWGVGDVQVIEAEGVPDGHFVDGFEPEFSDE